MENLPCQFPHVNLTSKKAQNGGSINWCNACNKNIHKNIACIEHYKKLTDAPSGYYQCHKGLTSFKFTFLKTPYAISGIIAHPRFNTENERDIAKNNPDLKTSRDAIQAFHHTLIELEALCERKIQESSKTIPQAFHELRKLNSVVLQSSERRLTIDDSDRDFKNINSAAELMKNNFDIIEAISNDEAMLALPIDADVHLFGLAFKTKGIYYNRAVDKLMKISVSGNDRIKIQGNRKSFPIIVAVLIENAIKYGKSGSLIVVDITQQNGMGKLSVYNETEHPIDPIKCFDKEARFAPHAAEGSGYGLFIAKRVVNAHKGSIHCETKPGEVHMHVLVPLH